MGPQAIEDMARGRYGSIAAQAGSCSAPAASSCCGADAAQE
jgi:hypothetical protein